MNSTRRDVFQAIADPTRREILGHLALQSMNLNDVAARFTISRPAISKHIKILTECGLIKINKQGRERHCIADLQKLKTVDQWLNLHRIFWSGKLNALETHLSKYKKN